MLFFVAIFFCSFRLSLVSAICPWVSEDAHVELKNVKKVEIKKKQVSKTVDDICFKKIARYFKLKGKPLPGAKLKNVLRNRPHSERCFRCQPVTEYRPFHMLSTVLLRLTVDFCLRWVSQCAFKTFSGPVCLSTIFPF